MRLPDSQLAEDFIELLSRHEGQLFGYIFALVHDRDDAQDVFQQTSLVLWRKFAAYEPGSSFGAWACHVARFEAMNFLRSRKRKRALFSDALLEELAELPPLEDPARQDHRELLAGCLKNLPESERELVLRCYQTSTTIKDIAADLGRSSQSVCNSLRRIREKLFECVDRKLAAEDGL